MDGSEVRNLQIDLANAPAEVRAKAPRAVRKTLFSIEADAKAFIIINDSVDTGNLLNSVGTDIDADGMGGEVGPTADYGAEVEYGTQPHIIRPRNARVLAFMGARGMVFAQEVHHPGTAPQPYMGPAFDRHAPRLELALGDIGEDIL